MVTLLKKFEELKERMEFFEIFQEDDEVGLLLDELEDEIKTFEEIEIYKEDFSEISWSYITKSKDVNYIAVYKKK